MLSIAIYSDQETDVLALKSIIQDFLIANKIMAKLSHFQKGEDLILVPTRYDIYIMDMDSSEDTIALGKTMMDIEAGSRFIYMSSDTTKAYSVFKLHADYFLEKPIDIQDFHTILTRIKQKIQEDNIIIKIPTGERRIRSNNLNYINIVKRCLCYHLRDGAMFDGQTLRTSFEKAIYPLQNSQMFLFLPPSLLINLSEIKIVNSDNIIFENEDVVYFPKKSYDIVREAWLNYNRIT